MHIIHTSLVLEQKVPIIYICFTIYYLFQPFLEKF